MKTDPFYLNLLKASMRNPFNPAFPFSHSIWDPAMCLPTRKNGPIAQNPPGQQAYLSLAEPSMRLDW
ncbi:MAG: hypothetical protein L6Q78_15695 [Bacteroidia bacterium]|nr:hypothetical protein [Bacteroidia bacterium]